MNLLECLEKYAALLTLYTEEVAEEFLKEAVPEGLHHHIKACFVPKGPYKGDPIRAATGGPVSRIGEYRFKASEDGYLKPSPYGIE